MSQVAPSLSRDPVKIEERRSLTFKEKCEVLSAFNRRCGSCREPFGNDELIEYDHILPLGLGGTNDLDNFAPLHVACHRSKTDADIARISKAKRLERDHDPETRRRSKRPIRSRGFAPADPLKSR